MANLIEIPSNLITRLNPWLNPLIGKINAPDLIHIKILASVIATTISPYLFFWQASEEVEPLKADVTAKPIVKAPWQARLHLSRIQIDTYIGMGFSNLVAFFIMLTAAVTLHAQGKGFIETSAQAAEALRPIAGDFAFVLFAAGIIGTGMLAIPVLAGSAAYAITGDFRWKNSLELRPALAKEFYAVIAFATLGGVMLDFTHLDPVKALYWSAVINGVISAPIMVTTMFMATNPKVMGKFVINRRLKFFGWMATGLMAIAVVVLFYTQATVH